MNDYNIIMYKYINIYLIFTNKNNARTKNNKLLTSIKCILLWNYGYISMRLMHLNSSTNFVNVINWNKRNRRNHFIGFIVLLNF